MLNLIQSQPSICVATSHAPKQSTETMADHHPTAQAYYILEILSAQKIRSQSSGCAVMCDSIASWLSQVTLTGWPN